MGGIAAVWCADPVGALVEVEVITARLITVQWSEYVDVWKAWRIDGTVYMAGGERCTVSLSIPPGVK